MTKTNVDDERLSDLHFQLSNADRRRIVEELLRESLKLNEVAKRLDLTATEAFRQLQRMTSAGLLEKIPDGKYRATPYAKLILESCSSLYFVSKHKDFFMEHDTSMIPPEFRIRLGELSRTVLMTEAVPNLNKATEVLKNAGKRVDVMVEQRLELHAQVLRERMLEGIKVRYLLQDSMLASEREMHIAHPPVNKNAEMRSIPRICAMVVLTDKEVGIALPRFDGKMDYAVFGGNDPDALRWAGDLFEDQWKKASPWHP